MSSFADRFGQLRVKDVIELNLAYERMHNENVQEEN